MPELEDAFTPGHWNHNSPALNEDTVAMSHFPDISPKEILLGKRKQWKRLPNKKSKIVEYPEKMYYISLIASIEIQLNNQKMLQMVAEPINNQSSSPFLTDVIHGALISDHELFLCDLQSLKIVLYYDDVEITNESTKRKHKLALFYYQLANIYPEYRSKLKSIQLVAIVEHRYLKKYGLDVIVKPFVEELKVLGRDLGYHFKICGGHICL